MKSRDMLDFALLGTALVSVPASFTPIANSIQTIGLDPLTSGLAICIGAVGAILGKRLINNKTLQLKAIDTLEHDLIHNLRDHTMEVSVLAQHAALTGEHFGNKTDHALKGAAEKLCSLLKIRTGRDCGVGIHLIDRDGKFPYYCHDSSTFKQRARARRKSPGYSSGMSKVLESDTRDLPIQYFRNLEKNYPDYEDTDVEDLAKLTHSVAVVAIQARVTDVVRNRHRKVFADSERLVAGFLTIDFRNGPTEIEKQEEALSKYADLLFETLALFAAAEVQQFGLENATIGRVATELFKPKLKLVAGEGD